MSEFPFELSRERESEISQTIAREPCLIEPWLRPEYVQKEIDSPNRVMMAVETFARHMTNEGWQLQKGLENAGYTLYGKYFKNDSTDAIEILEKERPDILFVQDKREWDAKQPGCFDKSVEFFRVPELAEHPEVFRVTVLKDLLFNRTYTATGHKELHPHAVVHYYHEHLIRWLAPWLKNTPLIRTYHSLDPEDLPQWRKKESRFTAIVSGAMNAHVYPLRTAVDRAIKRRRVHHIANTQHPGYHAKGAHTKKYLDLLSQFKVSICCSSVMGFLLRKIIESTAVGCVVITDLPHGDFPPGLEENMVFVESTTPPDRVDALAESLANSWNEEKQLHLAKKAIELYDYKKLYGRLSSQIDECRRLYWQGAPDAHHRDNDLREIR